MSNFFPTKQFKSVNSANLSIRTKQSLHVKVSDNPHNSIKYLSFRLFQGYTHCIPVHNTVKRFYRGNMRPIPYFQPVPFDTFKMHNKKLKLKNP